MGQITQTKTDHLSHRMSHSRQLFQINRRLYLYVPQRVEIFDRHIEFLSEKLRRVRHDRGAAREKKPLWRCPALLATIKLHRLVDLNVQPRHELPRDL